MAGFSRTPTKLALFFIGKPDSTRVFVVVLVLVPLMLVRVFGLSVEFFLWDEVDPANLAVRGGCGCF